MGLLGILKAGAAYLPLDPNYPRERLAFMLTDAGARLLITQQALIGQLPEATSADRHVVRLDADWPHIARMPATAPAVALDPRNPAYVIYTSGSTGTPKGVVVEHRIEAVTGQAPVRHDRPAGVRAFRTRRRAGPPSSTRRRFPRSARRPTTSCWSPSFAQGTSTFKNTSPAWAAIRTGTRRSTRATPMPRRCTACCCTRSTSTTCRRPGRRSSSTSSGRFGPRRAACSSPRPGSRTRTAATRPVGGDKYIATSWVLFQRAEALYGQ